MHLSLQRPHTSPFAALPATASAATNPSKAAGASASASAATSPDDSTSGTSTTATATITADDFLQLLVTELKNQDPTANTDPNEYVDQLVQVNSLQQLIQINENTDGGSSGSSSSVRRGAAAPLAGGGPSSLMAEVAAAKHAQSAAHTGTAHGNLSPNQVLPANFSAAANQVAGSLAPGHGDAVRALKPGGSSSPSVTSSPSGIPLQ